MTINEKCRKLPMIKTQHSPWGGGLQPDGISQLPFPIYSKEVTDWINAMYDLDLTDKNYFENMEKSKGKPVAELTRDEILTRMTFLIRAERYRGGEINEQTESYVM